MALQSRLFRGVTEPESCRRSCPDNILPAKRAEHDGRSRIEWRGAQPKIPLRNQRWQTGFQSSGASASTEKTFLSCNGGTQPMRAVRESRLQLVLAGVCLLST